jgi:hypothetical protein
MNSLVIEAESLFPSHLIEYRSERRDEHLPPFLTTHKAKCHLYRLREGSLLFSRLLWTTPLPAGEASCLIARLEQHRDCVEGIRVLEDGLLTSLLVELDGLPSCERLYKEFKVGQTDRNCVFFMLAVGEAVVLEPGLDPSARWLALTQGSLDGPALTALPTCYFCLQRLESFVTGLDFLDLFYFLFEPKSNEHCRVCRLLEGKEKGRCSCEKSSDLWGCMVCGEVGCGRYSTRHASEHFELSRHGMAIELSSQKIWSYELDEFVHRMIRSEEHGIVQLEHSGPSDEDKSEGLLREFCYLISDQLEQQRAYYIKRIREIEERDSDHAFPMEVEVAGLQRTVENNLAEIEELKEAAMHSKKKVERLLKKNEQERHDIEQLQTIAARVA